MNTWITIIKNDNSASRFFHYAIIAVILIAALYRWFLRRNRIDELHERKHHRQNNIDHTNPQNDETGDD